MSDYKHVLVEMRKIDVDDVDGFKAYNHLSLCRAFMIDSRKVDVIVNNMAEIY